MERRPPASRTLKPTKLGAAIALLSVGLVYLAQISGRWQSRLSESDFRVGLMMMEVRGMNVHKTGRQNLPTQ